MIETGRVKVVAGQRSAAAAQTWAERLSAMAITAVVGQPGKGDIVVAVLDRADEKMVPAEVFAALDLSLHVIVLRTEPFTLPKALDHLPVIDAADREASDRLVGEIARASDANAPLAVKVLTPTARRANRSFGFFVSGLALLMFIVGIVAVGAFGLSRPADEYDAIDTQVVQTRDFLVGPELLYYSTWLPRSTEDAANYRATLQQLPTAYRPLMGLTVTAYAQGTPLPPITTPVPQG